MKYKMNGLIDGIGKFLLDNNYYGGDINKSIYNNKYNYPYYG